MCSYKRVQCSFEVYGFQTRTEDFVHKVSFFLSPFAVLTRGSWFEDKMTILI